jgi:hypothetical protein
MREAAKPGLDALSGVTGENPQVFPSQPAKPACDALSGHAPVARAAPDERAAKPA